MSNSESHSAAAANLTSAVELDYACGGLRREWSARLERLPAAVSVLLCVPVFLISSWVIGSILEFVLMLLRWNSFRFKSTLHEVLYLGAFMGVTFICSYFVSRIVFLRLRWSTIRSSTPICEKCGFDLRGSSSGVCPECGTAIRADTKYVNMDNPYHPLASSLRSTGRSAAIDTEREGRVRDQRRAEAKRSYLELRKRESNKQIEENTPSERSPD